MKITVSYPTIKRGSKGEIVVQLQDLLARNGSSVRISGIYDVGTVSAVGAFQRKHGLKIDGIAGPETWKQLLIAI